MMVHNKRWEWWLEEPSGRRSRRAGPCRTCTRSSCVPRFLSLRLATFEAPFGDYDVYWATDGATIARYSFGSDRRMLGRRRTTPSCKMRAGG